MRTHKNILTLTAVLGMLTVLFGAFGAHGLKKIVSPEQVETFKTGVTYQMYHVFALLALGLSKIADKHKKQIAIFMAIGILLFSGSIYLLTFKDVLSLDISFIGPATPIGGVCFIVGWGLMAWRFKNL
ncbi:membrane protein [Neptunitalea chrysea]|uniref:Membrane protein n=1 Tax=Neptunitalea chrysea TaxID=1647581 RepID=A0A9W6EU92_9FLAO|nr:DUF423 domain-containing protein [Neptunitalea chrysea]GLB51411.1 membrane protein [Neptunitalea chrysea]